MKKLVSQLLPLLLSLFILGASTSWTFASHYCGSIKIDTALFGSPAHCGMEMLGDSNSSDAKPSCCNELEEMVTGAQLFKTRADSYELAAVLFFVPTQTLDYLFTAQAAPTLISSSVVHPPPMGGVPIYLFTQEYLL